MNHRKRFKEKEYSENTGNFMNIQTQRILGWILVVSGIIVGISALPRQYSHVVDVFFFKVNLGTQLDIIRFLMCIALIWVGWKGVKGKW